MSRYARLHTAAAWQVCQARALTLASTSVCPCVRVCVCVCAAAATPATTVTTGKEVEGTVAAAVARTRSKKKAAEAAQQLWHEWAEENLAAMAPRAQRERLPQDTKHLLTTTGGSSKLVQVRLRRAG